MKKRALSFIAALSLLPFASAADPPRVVVLAFDGMDANRVHRLLDAGALPNLKKLAERGTFAPLIPPPLANSPVTWATLLTGVSAGKHGLHDFVKRSFFGDDVVPMLNGPRTELVDPASLDADTRRAIAAAYEVGEPALGSSIPFARGGLTVPLVFETLDRAGIRCDGVRVPVAFPPPALANGRLLTGLFAPDVRGGAGSWAIYTNDVWETDGRMTDTGGTMMKLYAERDGTFATVLSGPRDFGERAPDDPVSTSVPITFAPDFTAKSVVITTGGRGETVKEGAWSDWYPVRFTLASGIAIDALARFAVEHCSRDANRDERLCVYVPPLPLSPKKNYPNIPLSSPPGHLPELANAVGLFDTIGWRSATNAFKDGTISFATFVHSLELMLDEDERLLEHELARSDWDFLLFATMLTDHAGHGSAVTAADRSSPVAAFGRTFPGERLLDETYREADRIVGDVAARLRSDDVLLVLSDHGMADFKTAVELNRWLLDEGFAAASERPVTPNDPYLGWCDWTKTRAYALGLGTIYLNLQGREPHGIVAPAAAAALKAEIRTKLLALRDPQHGNARVIRDVFDVAAIWPGPREPELPDLAVGFEPGYRVGWQTTVGARTEHLFTPNDKSWQMDHCSVASDAVPGVLFSSRALDLSSPPAMVDLAPTLLALFGVAVPTNYEGRSLVASKR